MGKNMKLGTKIAGGFTIVLILTAIVGYVGFNGLGGVTDIVDKADDGNRLIKFAKDCRIEEKNFIMRGDKKYQKENDATMVEIYEQIDTTMAKLKDTDDKAMLSKVESSAKAYKDNFDGWIELWDEQQVAEKGMLDNARAFVAECDTLRVNQKDEYETLLKVQVEVADGSRAHLNWAGAVKDFLADKNATLDVQTDGHKCDFGKWIDSSEFSKQLSVCGQEFRQIIEDMRQKHLDLHAGAIDVKKARTGTSDTSLEVYQGKVASVLEENLAAFAKLEEIISTRATDKLWKADSANRLIKWAKDSRVEEKNFIMRGDKKYQKENDTTMDRMYSLCDELSSSFEQQGNKDQVAKVKSASKKYKENFDGWIVLWDKQQVAEENMVTHARELTQLCEDLRAGQKTKMDATTARSNTMMIIGAIAAIAIGSLLAFFITRGIVKPITRIIAGLTEGSEQVASASGQVSAASQSLAEGATEQAAGLEETSSSLEEMASMTKQNADNAQQANALAGDARKAGDTGNESMGRMNTAIQDIQKSSEETAKIIKVIDEIAFQTNLLALNAAVEAARAGEAGKGFAVVAEEVRNLAMRSAEAAKDTSAMIEGSVKNANNGVEIASEVSKVLEEIVEGIGKTTDLVSEIAAASQEQSQGIDQVNTAVNQMDKVTQQNAANAEESASASEELSAQAEQMGGIVEELAALVGGSSQVNARSSAVSKKTLKTSDHAFHQIADGANKAPASSGNAEKAIPLGGKSDFDGFNG